MVLCTARWGDPHVLECDGKTLVVVGIRGLLAVNLQLRPPALSNFQLTPLGSTGGMPGHRDLVHARGGSENQGGGPGGPYTGIGVSSPGG